MKYIIVLPSVGAILASAMLGWGKTNKNKKETKAMKKAITLALVGAMLTATGITAFAAPVTADSDPKTGGTTVNYQVAPVYTVVIPETVTLGNTAVTEQINIYGATADDNVVIGKTQKVNVALTASANDFKVKTADGDEVAYTVNDKNAVADLTTVAECTAAEGKKNTDITFTKTGTAAYAGTYTDTLTFTIGVEAAATQKTLTISAPADAIEDKSVTITYTTGQKWGEIDLPDGWSFNDFGYLTSGDWFIVGSDGPIEAGNVIDETLNYYLYKD